MKQLAEMLVVAQLLFLGQVWEIESLAHSDSVPKETKGNNQCCVYFTYSTDTGQRQQIASLVPASTSVIRAVPFAPTAKKVGEGVPSAWMSPAPWVKCNLQPVWNSVNSQSIWTFLPEAVDVSFFFTVFSASDIHVLWQMSFVSDLKFVNTITGWAAMVETSAIAHVILTLKFFTLRWRKQYLWRGWVTHK